MTIAPWGIARMEPYPAVRSAPAVTALIDPDTQVAVFVDELGRRVEMGAHGTSTETSTPTNTGGGDGQNGGQNAPTDMDSMPANDQDQGTG